MIMMMTNLTANSEKAVQKELRMESIRNQVRMGDSLVYHHQQLSAFRLRVVRIFDRFCLVLVLFSFQMERRENRKKTGGLYNNK